MTTRYHVAARRLPLPSEEDFASPMVERELILDVDTRTGVVVAAREVPPFAADGEQERSEWALAEGVPI